MTEIENYEQIAHDIIEMVALGDLDASLGTIQGACLQRQKLIHFGKEQKPEQQNGQIFKRGAIVEVAGQLKPNYLFGHRFKVLKVNPKTCLVWIPDEPVYRRFRNQEIRIPKMALKVVA